ncbi:uncharacterized protein MKZ38_007084 [Zalerion maritima]|uniref:TECPR1-like DysF domain-containing protein n=1 Tax=Zalerion maritima TaxID=339359 RepID=A0AAD5RIG9_9PEZI|nr:uncharacterized protein MKZ38_007084 [Zalerion maritima]
MDDFTAEMIAASESSETPGAATATAQQQKRDDYFGGVSSFMPSSSTVDAAINRDVTPSPAPPEDGSGGKSSRRAGFRGRFSALKDRANIQDRLVEKLLQHVIPEEEGEYDGSLGGGSSTGEGNNEGRGGGNNLENPNLDATIDVDDVLANRPNFNITTMSNNFRRFNARIGVVFRFQVRMMRLLGWRKYSHTLSFLAVYTFVCLDPYLLVLVPLAALLLGVLIPSFMARHPPVSPQHPGNAGQILQQHQYSAASMEYSPRGPPIAPARTVKPVKELSRDFFRNMRDLQNSMEDFSVAHDSIISLVVPTTNFSDESVSSAVFLGLFVAFLLLSIAAHLIPWKVAALLAGWAGVGMGHPAAKRMVNKATRDHNVKMLEEPKESVSNAQSALKKFAKGDMVLDVAPETREVEIFELQRKSSENDEWEAWLFTSNPYDPLSASRIAGERPKGTRFFEDVLPPEGWDWSEKKWALDLWSRDWVEERIITAVEVETEGERWIYDMLSSFDRKGEGGEVLVVDFEAEREKERELGKGGRKKGVSGASSLGGAGIGRPSWEEGDAVEGDGDVVGRRGEWRRRRWVRLVKRTNISVP